MFPLCSARGLIQTEEAEGDQHVTMEFGSKQVDKPSRRITIYRLPIILFSMLLLSHFSPLQTETKL